ncbi:hypothetical protein Tco_0678040 [Tanacetum coccineum]|uniref:Uncharacterized protein n=1 Tax=Tanacetum coccineum TaxID=301880 RepID=A0ABQ4XDW1_9ASTR
MNPIAIQQAALDNALVPSKKGLKIKRCVARIAFSKPQKEETYQVTLEALKLSPCYPAFVITAEVSEIYMHQFWTTIKKIGDSDAYNFKLEKKKNLAILADVICYLQFTLIKCTSLGEHLLQSSTGASLGKQQDLIDSGNFMYQADNREISSARKEHMPYPRFTKVIINHFISKDKTISMRNMINLHTIRDDSLLGTLKFVSKTQDYQQYGALIPDDIINQDIKDSQAYKTYYDFATGKVPPRKARKYMKVASPPRKLSPVKEAEPVKKAKRVKRPAKKSTTAPTAGVVIRDTPGVSVSKKKAPTKADRIKGIEILSDVALLEATQLKEATKRSKKDFHISQASGSGDGTDLESGVPDEQQRKTSGTDEGTGTIPRVPDVPKYQFESDDESWGDSEDDSLRMADSHTGNHPKDDFTPLKTIRRSYSVIREKIPFELERETFEPERGAISNVQAHVLFALNATLCFMRSLSGKPSVDLLRSFLNLGRAGDWLTLSNRGGADVPKALIKPVTHLENWKGLKTSWINSPKRPVIYHHGHEMDFRSFMIQGVDGEFNFLLEGGFDDNQGSFSVKSVNNETLIIDTEPISVVLPKNVADNIIDSNKTSSDDELPPVHPPTSSLPKVGEKSKAAGKRKLGVDALREGSHYKARRAPAQASKVAGDALTPLDVDSDLDIHGKFEPVYGIFVPSLSNLLMFFPFLFQHLRDISIEQLCDIHDRACMRQAVLDNMLNGRTRKLISALHKARESCDAIREREVKRDKAYADLEKKCNEAHQDLDKNPLVSDMRSEIKTLQGQVNGLHNKYGKLLVEKRKWANYEQTLSLLRAKIEGFESERERLKASEIQVLQDIDSLRQDRAAAVSKVIPDAAMKLVHSDEMGVLVARIVRASIIYGRCMAFEEVSRLKEPFCS